jgi:iron complex transport system substrate-binding protein
MAGASESTVDLPQHSGGTLVLEAPARRIVTLAPHLAELAYLAGAGDRLVATVEYSDFPAEAAGLPRIGDAFRFDLERLLALEPDLVVAWGSGNPKAAVAAMEQLGLQVWRTEIRTVGDMARLIRDLGRATGLDSAARADALERRWADLENRHAGREPVRYFYQVAERPLYTVSGDHLISHGLAACGAVNLFEDLPALAPQIDPEAVLQADPDVLVAGRLDGGDDPLAAWRAWPRLAAVRDDAFFYLPADLINRATPRLLDAVETACTLFDEYRQRRKETRNGP